MRQASRQHCILGSFFLSEHAVRCKTQKPDTGFTRDEAMLQSLVSFLSSRGSNMAADDRSTSSSSTLDWSSEPPPSPTSPSHLTHFKPLTPDQDEPPLRSAYSSLVSLFRFNKGDRWCFHKSSWELSALSKSRIRQFQTWKGL